ncbi:MAG: hypothetical protein ACR2PM_20000 [Hyphomicrobiales bacterium]
MRAVRTNRTARREDEETVLMFDVSMTCGLIRRTLVAAALTTAVLPLPAALAQSGSCDVIADQLEHQNTPLEDAAQRLTPCARKYAKYDDSLKTRSKGDWRSLCEKNNAATYRRLADNRETILRRCQPRGSFR